MAGRLTVKKKGYTRKAYVAKSAGKKVHVAASEVPPRSFKVKDGGRSGRRPKMVPPLEEGSLGGKGFFSKPASERHAVLKRLARKLGETSVVGKLRAVQVFNKRVNPALS